MSYYFAIVGVKDTPLFEHEFGTSKAGGDGQARFRPEARHMNQFIVHASLDIVDEVQWSTGQMYLKHIDRFHNNFVSCFLTPSNIKFLLLYNPDAHISSGNPTLGNSNSSTSNMNFNPAAAAAATSIYSTPFAAINNPTDQTSSQSTFSANTSSASMTASTAAATAATTNFNPTASTTEEAHRAFFVDVFDAWVKTAMNPFYAVEGTGMGMPMPIRSPVFRNRVVAAGKKFL